MENNLDPASLPDDSVGFSMDVGFITVHGEAKIYNGYFAGLSTIERSGDTSLNTDPAANKVTLTAKLALPECKAGYDARAEIIDIGVSASADIKVTQTKVSLAAEMELAPGATLKLTQFDITDIGHIDVHFSGLGPLDFILDSLVNLVANIIKGEIAGWISGPLKDLLQNALDGLPPPFGP